MRTTRSLDGSTRPWPSSPHSTCTTPGAAAVAASSDPGDVVLGEPLDGALRLAVAGHDDDDASTRRPASRGCRRGPPRCRRGRPAWPRCRVPDSLVVVEAERRQAQPGVAERTGLVVGVVERAERGRAEVDRRLRARGRGRPRRLQELLARRDQVVGAGPDPLGVAQQHGRRRRQEVDERLHVADQHRCQRLHALDRMALGQLREQVPSTTGCSAASSAARARTSSVSSSSRHGGAQSSSTASSERWSATANRRISSTVSPQNSTRSGCSSVGGKTSTMPPRTANSPRRSTRSTRT